MVDGGYSLEHVEQTVPRGEILFVYVVGGGPEPLVIWPAQTPRDVIVAGGHSTSGVAGVQRVLLDSGLLARMKALNDETEGAVADLFAAIHAAGMVHAGRQGAASRR